MQRKQGNQIPSTEQQFADLMEALKLLGLAIARAAVYGSRHPAAEEAASTAFDALDLVLWKRKRPLELSTEAGELLIDGESASSEPALAGLLAPQLARHGRLVLVLSPPLQRQELLELIGLLAQPPPSQFEPRTSMAERMAAAGWKTIKPVKGHYARVTGEEAPKTDRKTKTAPAPDSPKQDRSGTPAGGGPKVMDLTGALAADLGTSLWNGSGSDQAHHDRLNHLNDRLKRAVALLNEDNSTAPDAGRLLIQELLLDMQQVMLTVGARITSLAADAAADRPVVRDIEYEAIGRGIKLRTTREELLAQLAELHQELLQPLTVVSGALETILGGLMGEVTPPQQSLLQLAFDSVTAVSEIANRVTELVGYPEGLTPQPQIADREVQP